MSRLRSKQVAWLSRALELGLDTGRLQEGKGREGEAGARGRVTSLTSPLPRPWVGCQVLGSFDRHPLAPAPMGTCWMTTGKSPASGALAYLPLTSAGPTEAGGGGEEAGPGGGPGCTLTSGFLASCSLTSISR